VFDLECNLFQALQYALIGEDALLEQILNRIDFHIRKTETFTEAYRVFSRILKQALRMVDSRKKLDKMQKLWNNFIEIRDKNPLMFWYLRLDKEMLRKIAFGSRQFHDN
jgi:hypothetical protein